jgi:hypothetical protein
MSNSDRMQWPFPSENHRLVGFYEGGLSHSEIGREENLVSLCLSCNPKVNHDRNRWIRFFRERLMEANCA